MAKTREVHACSTCGFSSPKWFGRCPDCGDWSTASSVRTGADGTAGLLVGKLGGTEDVEARWPTSLGEVDRVLGGGIVPGSVVLLAGEPGIGKSTLVLQLLDGLSRGGRTCFMVTGEESLQQVGMRASRLGVDGSGFAAAAGTSLPSIIAAASEGSFDVVVVDSIQTLEDPTLDQGAGSITQVRDCASSLVRFAKESGTAVIIVGHVTKEGSVAGPKTLEHVVDAVVMLEGERTGSMRLLRASKNRFGSCDEVGVFTMEAEGLVAVADPSALLLADRCIGIPGSVVFPSIEGTRPVLVEMQALTPEAPAPQQARRTAIGLDGRRLALLLGVLDERLGLGMGSRDVFAAAAGGLSIKEPAADLAIALALASSFLRVPVPSHVAAFGEIGLGGEVRRVPSGERRLSEAHRMGYTQVVAPRGIGKAPSGLTVTEVSSVAEAVSLMRDMAKSQADAA